MMNLVRAEWIKLRTVRSTWALLFVSLGVTVAVAGLVGYGRRNEDLAYGDTVVSMLSGFLLSMFIIGVSAVLLVSSEFRTGTIRSTLAARPNRWSIIVAKLIVIAAAAAGIAIVMCSLAVLLARGVLALSDARVEFTGDDWASFAGAIIFFTLFAIWGMGLALIIRHSAGAICALILWPLIGEGILLTVVTNLLDKEWLMRFMPYTAGVQLFANDAGGGSDIALSRVTAGLYFGAFVFVVLGIGVWLFHRRDA